ncbi:MAG TPA: carboxypeptidase regulatory-like domain-containing protein, partial [Acidimicrobiales bacterium]|nr:carboxypeptidase regulatory-like domain-containing protein [Acidimicrobiales bacterium]
MAFIALLLACTMGLFSACKSDATVLSGTVAVVGGGAAPQGVTVTAFSDASPSIVAITTTNSVGAFRFGSDDLAAGEYRVRFGDGSWWQDSASWATATAVHADKSAPAVLEATISAPTGGIQGTVARRSGRPIANATVTLRDHRTNDKVASTTTASDGSYGFAGLSARTIVVAVSGPTYASSYTGDATTSSAATPVVVDGTTTTSGVDVTLSPGATLSGSIGGVGSDRSGFWVAVFDRATQQAVRSTATGSNGGFTFDDLPAGDYGVTVFDPSGRFQSRTVGAAGNDPATGTTYRLAANQSRSVGTVMLSGADCPTPSAGTDLTGFDFAGANLANCDLTGSVLNRVHLAGANLSGATLS